MEPRGRRGSRAPIETAASEPQPTPPSGDPAPQVAPPLAAAPAVADEPGARDGDSPTAPAAVEESAEDSWARPPEALEAPAAPRAADDRPALDRDSLTALATSQAALARGLVALGFEIAGLACSGFETAARAATRLLAVRTPSEAARLQADYLQRSLGAAWIGSARLSNLGVEIAAQAAEPLVAQLGRDWVRAARRAR
jgi:hypothetical protein